MYQSPPPSFLDPPFPSIRCSFTYSFVRFVCSLIAQKSIQGNVQKCHKEEEKRKEEKEVRLETERRRNERANVCPSGIH